MYQEQDLVRIAKRENNNKRSYLVVRDLDLARISPVSNSIITASVYVPPVSNPNPILLIATTLSVN